MFGLAFPKAPLTTSHFFVSGEKKFHFPSPFMERGGGHKKKAGDVLLSHTVTRAVPSTQKSLTSEFGMGSGVASLLLSPARLKKR